MPYGFGGGLGYGFAAGVNAGTNMSEAKTRRDAIMQEQIQEKISQAYELVGADLKNLQQSVSQISQPSSQVDDMVDSRLQMHRQTGEMISQLPGGKQYGQAILNMVETAAPNMLTSSQLTTRKIEHAGMTYDIAQGNPPEGSQPQASGFSSERLPDHEVAAQPPVDPRRQQYVNSAMGIEPTPFEKKAAEEQAKYAYGEGLNLATGAKKMLKANEQAMAIINDGMMTGAFADQRVFAQKVAAWFGMEDKEAYRLAQNSERFMALMAGPTAQIIKNFGAGTGLSDADREFARMAAGGEITMSEGAIRDILYINSKAAIGDIQEYNSRVPAEMQMEIPPDVLAAYQQGPQSQELQDIYTRTGETAQGLGLESQAQAAPPPGQVQDQGQGQIIEPPKLEPPVPAIEALRKDPSLADQFEAFYGRPAKQYLGQ